MESKTVPYLVHEGCLARDERVIKRLVIALVLTIVLMFASNGIWLYAWMQYDYVEETTSETTTTTTTTNTTQDGEGINIYGGGDVNYGADDNSNEDDNKDSNYQEEIKETEER